MQKSALRDKIFSGSRISRSEAVGLFSWDILDLGAAADARRRIVHPEDTVGFILDRIVNYSNICEAQCGFCAYHARAGFVEPYELGIDGILGKIDELARMGGTQVMLQGGLHPERGLEHYEAMAAAVKERFPDIVLHSFSPAEIIHMSRKSGVGLNECVARLKSAGVESVPGASDILVDRIRKIVSPNKISRDEWKSVMLALAENGMKSSATMTYGMGESIEEKAEHLDFVRSVQDETGIIRAFIPWSFSPGNTGFEGMVPAGGIEFLKVVAIARIYLDNIKFIQAGWLTEGLGLAQIALSFGANDMGGVLTEELVVKATGVERIAGMDDFIGLIRAAGRVPVQRDSDYRTIRTFR
ncbi:MAG: CofH family radical SAM protein [Spirochaetes bacterium]|nr:CofH family radical SAM protein [Spirochaetota bacterium]